MIILLIKKEFLKEKIQAILFGRGRQVISLIWILCKNYTGFLAQ